jgi:hypothetical protein
MVDASVLPSEFVSESGVIYKRCDRHPYPQVEKTKNYDPVFDTQNRLRLWLSCALWSAPMYCEFAVYDGIGGREVIDYSKFYILGSNGGAKVAIASYS